MGCWGRKVRGVAAVALAVGVVAGSVGPAAASPGRTDRSRPSPLDVTLPDDPATCDPLDPAHCLLPFPNDFFTVADDTTDTGRRVNLAPDTTPLHPDGVTELNRNDGFSPGSAIAVLLPGIDLTATGAAPITDMGRSLDRDAPIVIVDAKTGKRHPHWAEVDANAPSDEERLTFIRPAENFREGRRYIVAVRDIVDADGRAIEPSDAFRAYRDRLATGIDKPERRRDHMEDIFRSLRRAKVDRDDLVLAWDFTVASERNLSERLLAMRDDAFDQLGDAAPSFTVTQVSETHKETVLHLVEGTFEVPNYLTGDGSPGSVLNNGDGPGSSPIPQRNGTLTVSFGCTIPAAAVRPDGTANPSRMALWGHGLLGAGLDVHGVGPFFFYDSNTTLCGADWTGLSSQDVSFLVEEILSGESSFRTVADRLQQAMVSFLYLARLMAHPDGLSSDPAFHAANGTPLLDREKLTFVNGNQAGIGGALSAVAQDWERSYLGVSAMNVSTFFDRSVNFELFRSVSDPSFDSWVERQLSVPLNQMLWDRAETNGYAQHLTRRPYRDTPAKQVMLLEAFGNHQVPNVATEVMARTIDAKLRQPALAEGRSLDVEPFWGIDPVRRLPGKRRPHAPVFHPRDARGPVLVVWDFQTPAPPTQNVPNLVGQDPHNGPLNEPVVRGMVARFLDDGVLVDACDGEPCQSTLPEVPPLPDG